MDDVGIRDGRTSAIAVAVATEITTVSAGKSTIEFYFRPAGVPGAIMGDNSWVCAKITDTRSTRARVVNVWADTPCDGVKRLSQLIGVPGPQCEDAAFF
jgi:hypothetical protein